MKTIVIANQKGGIGKTTTATALASMLTEKGFKTLLIDADPQGNSTDTYKAEIEGKATLYDVILDNDRIPLEEAIQHTEAGYIVASDILLKDAEKILTDADALYRLQDAISELKGWDYVIIDTAPAMGSMLYNCLIACDEVIIPITADRYGLQGLAQLNQTIQTIQKRQNRNLKIRGLLLVKFNPRTNLSKETKELLQEIVKQMDTVLFNTTIRESTKTKEAQAKRKLLIQHNAKSTTAIDYKNFVDELIGEVK